MRHWSMLVVLCASASVFGCAAGDPGGDGVDLTNCVDQDNDNHYTGLQCAVASDCNDRDRTIYPGAIEIPGDGKDNDCKGGDAAKPNDCGASVDKDRDGYFDPNLPPDKIPQDCLGRDCFDDPHTNPCQVANAPPGVCLDSSNVRGSTLRGRSINPGRREVANNGIDDDCNPATQDDRPNCTDADGDGYGPQGNSDCPGRQPTEVDCNDADGDINPGAAERCDGKDNNCNNTTDECAQASYACSSINQGSCVGVLGGACTNHRDCGANFRCKNGSCKAFTGGDCGFAANANDDCYSGVCGDNLKCAGDICQVLTCGAASPCPGGDPAVCDSALGRCVECRDSSTTGGCECGYCAGYQCYDGEYGRDVVDKGVSAGEAADATVELCEDACGMDGDNSWSDDGACDDGGEDSEFGVCDLGTDCTDCGSRQVEDGGDGVPAGPPAPHAVVQVAQLLLECFGYMGDDAPQLCAAINSTHLSTPVNEDQIDRFFCHDELPDEERDNLAAELLGGGGAERARDLAGCGLLGSLFGDDLKFENAIGPNAEYRDCIWYHDNRIQVGDCMLYPSEL